MLKFGNYIDIDADNKVFVSSDNFYMVCYATVNDIEAKTIDFIIDKDIEEIKILSSYISNEEKEAKTYINNIDINNDNPIY